MNKTTQLLRSHRSIRKFKDKPVSDELINEIVLCAQAAATSSNIQATTIIRVRDEEKRERLAEVAGGQSYVTTAGAFLVFCADLNRSKLACQMQGGEFSEGMTEHFIIATADVALAAQNAVIAAESLGLGICYIGGLRNKPEEVADLLALPDQVYPVFGLCIGYADQDPEVKPRLPLATVLKEDSYLNPADISGIETYDETLREYYQLRTGGKKDSCWSEEMKALVGKESRPHMREFLAKRGFLMK